MEAPLLYNNTPKESLDPIKIIKDSKEYILNIDIQGDYIIFDINDTEDLISFNYKNKMTFKEIKDLNQIFIVLNSFNDFYDYIKALSNNKKLSIKKEDEKIIIILYVEILLKEQIIEINLFKEKKDLNLSIKDICKELILVKEKVNNLTTENKELRIIIDKQNKEIKYMKDKLNKLELYINPNFDDSVIIKNDESNFIILEIERLMNRKIKSIRKLYQATIDGGEPSNFHSKCDNIPFTVTLIKSEGNRRFGGFTPIPWESEDTGYKKGEGKSFVFSLDNKKIYNINKGSDEIFNCKKIGPCFGRGYDIGIEGNPIKEKVLFTYKSSYNYNGEYLPLSEYKEDGNKLLGIDYEVFQISFY